MRRVHVVYSGRVQGVGFRATTRSIAAKVGVTGWVRNDAEGTVTMEAEGETPQIDTLLDAIDARLGGGITSAHVTDIEPAAGELEFRIIR